MLNKFSRNTKFHFFIFAELVINWKIKKNKVLNSRSTRPQLTILCQFQNFVNNRQEHETDTKHMSTNLCFAQEHSLPHR